MIAAKNQFYITSKKQVVLFALNQFIVDAALLALVKNIAVLNVIILEMMMKRIVLKPEHAGDKIIFNNRECEIIEYGPASLIIKDSDGFEKILFHKDINIIESPGEQKMPEATPYRPCGTCKEPTMLREPKCIKCTRPDLFKQDHFLEAAKMVMCCNLLAFSIASKNAWC